MSEPLRRRWTWDAYLEWEAQQERRHELVDGEVRAMTGGSFAHDVISTNLKNAVRDSLRDRPCRAFGPEVKVATGNGNARYPDVLVDCGRYRPSSVVAEDPVAVFEVLSRSTAWVDQTFKLRDYDATPSIRYYVMVSQDEMRAVIYARDNNGRFDLRNAALVEGPEAAIVLPSLDIALPLPEIYADALD